MKYKVQGKSAMRTIKDHVQYTIIVAINGSIVLTCFRKLHMREVRQDLHLPELLGKAHQTRLSGYDAPEVEMRPLRQSISSSIWFAAARVYPHGRTTP